jgi:hypothetical protein
MSFLGCTGLVTVTLPKATSIAASTFTGCTKLTTVTLPKVTSIGNLAFSGCTSLATVVLGSTPPTIGNTIFNAAASEARTITFKAPDPSAYTTSPWTDKTGSNSSAGYYWDNSTNPNTRDNLTVALTGTGE